MYKDRDKQREAQRNWVRQKRAVKGSTEQGSTEGVTVYVDGECGSDKNEGTVDKPMKSIDRAIASINPKRGKDIKCFVDLHPSIQLSIDKMSLVDGRIDQTIKANRTAIAIDYQHKHPDRYHPTGAVFTGSMTVIERLFL